jgi:sugar lactone lactonase YvrE
MSVVTGVVTDSAGNLYFADATYHRVRKISANGIVTTIAGNGTASDIAGFGTAASIKSPVGLTIDSAGSNLYVTTGGYRVVKLSLSTQEVTFFAGSGVQGAYSGGVFGSGNDGTGTGAKFVSLGGIVIDASAANIFVVDGYSGPNLAASVIRKITVPGAVVSTLTTTGAAIGSNANQMTIDSTGSNLYIVCQSSHIAQKIATVGSASCAVSLVAGTSGSAGYTTSTLSAPCGIFLNAAKTLLYISDSATIRTVSPANTVASNITTLAGTGTTAYLDAVGLNAQFSYPLCITSDPSGSNLYIGEYSTNNRIRRLNLASTSVTTYAGNGNGTFQDGIIPSGTIMTVPGTLATSRVTASNSMIVSGGASLLPETVTSNHWTVSGFSNTITSITGTYSSTTTNDALIYTFTSGSGGFTVPAGGLVVDYLIVGGGGGGGTWVGGGGGAGGLVYAKDVQIPAGTYTWTVGTGGAGGTSTGSSATSGGNGTNSSISVTGLTITALGGGGGGSFPSIPGQAGGSGGGSSYTMLAGTAAIGQGNNGGGAGGGGGGGAGGVGAAAGAGAAGGIGLAISITGSNVYYAGGGGQCGDPVQGAGGLGGGGKGALTESGGGYSQLIAPTAGTTNTGGGGGGGARGSTNIGGAGGSGVIILRVYTNTNTRMLIGDGTGYSMSLASQSNSVTNDVFTVSDQGNVNIGMSNALFNNPTYCAFDSLSNMYVAEQLNHRVRKITPAGIVTTVLGNGLASNSTGLYGTGASVNAPYGIAVDSTNNLFISSLSGHVILYFNTTTGLSTIVAGTGSAASTNGNGTAAAFNQPRFMAYDAAGTGGPWVWIAEGAGSNIRKMLAVSPYTVTTLSSNANGINLPIGIALDSANSFLYVANFSGSTLIKISSIYGTPTYSNVATSITNIAGLCLDSGKTTLYFTETNTSTIRKVATTGGTVTTVAGSTTLTYSYTNPDATGTSARFWGPNSVTLDPAGSNIYIAEQPPSRIRKLNIATSNVTTYAAGAGWSGAWVDGSIPTTTTVNNTLAVKGSASISNTDASFSVRDGNAYFNVNCAWQGYGGLSMNGYLQVALNGTTTSVFMVPADTNGNAWYSNGTGGFGIGTTSPAYTLDVNGTGRVVTNGTVSTSAWAGYSGTDTLAVMTNAAGGVNSNGVASILFGNSTVGNFPYGRIATIDQQVGNGAFASTMVFQTNGGGVSLAERMRIHTNGFVGINTTTPATALDVSGGVTIRNGYRPLYSNVSSGTSFTIPSASYGTHFNITASSITGITLPTGGVSWANDSNAYWVFRNNTSGYLSITFTYTGSYTSAPTNPVTIPPANSVTLMLTYPLASTSNYVLF